MDRNLIEALRNAADDLARNAITNNSQGSESFEVVQAILSVRAEIRAFALLFEPAVDAEVLERHERGEFWCPLCRVFHKSAPAF